MSQKPCNLSKSYAKTVYYANPEREYPVLKTGMRSSPAEGRVKYAIYIAWN
jgi:hypothetical protein